eukprot:745965-Hanusia_phi.AAC.2
MVAGDVCAGAAPASHCDPKAERWPRWRHECMLARESAVRWRSRGRSKEEHQRNRRKSGACLDGSLAKRRRSH